MIAVPKLTTYGTVPTYDNNIFILLYVGYSLKYDTSKSKRGSTVS